MSVLLNISMFKIIFTPIIVGVHAQLSNPDDSEK